uniref:Uncharacterized protein n=1 Tax=Romanomermis culicivorax TaxID=13658 RepID=A0A915IE33_ROMCU
MLNVQDMKSVKKEITHDSLNPRQAYGNEHPLSQTSRLEHMASVEVKSRKLTVNIEKIVEIRVAMIRAKFWSCFDVRTRYSSNFV